MKVTTELKNLIRRSFDEKRANVSNEIKSVVKDLFEEKRNEVISSKEFKAYVKACKALYERFENDYKSEGDYYSGNTAYRLRIEGFNDIKPEDIISEGKSQKHCVATYVNKMSEGHCTICFIRKKDNIESSYYTVEISPDNHIVQVRGFANQLASIDVQEFVLKR